MHWDNFGWQFWHWWHGWTWWIGTYDWLEANNLWKATVAFFTTVLLGALLTAAMRPWRIWKEHKETQRAIADRLDSTTPGGITDLIKALREVLDDLEEGDAPDDNGTDPGRQRRRRSGRSGHHVPETEKNPFTPHHGGGSAGHH